MAALPGRVLRSMFAEFVSQNLLWVAAFVVVANLWLFSLLQANVAGSQWVSPLQLPQLQRGGNSVIVDVNEPAEYARSHIPESVNMPLAQIKADNKALMKMQGKTAIVVCQTGSRSTRAAKQLVALGFKDVHMLRGGLAAWTKENLPLSTG